MHHMQMIKDVQLALEIHSDVCEESQKAKSKDGMSRTMMNIAKKDDDGRMLVLQLFMHAADISNPLKPYAICSAWAFRCLDEFFSQGDREKGLGIPVQMLNDRYKVNKPQSQIGFIEFVVSPLIALKIRMMPSLRHLGEELVQNQL